jgi:hypothetical protein
MVNGGVLGSIYYSTRPSYLQAFLIGNRAFDINRWVVHGGETIQLDVWRLSQRIYPLCHDLEWATQNTPVHFLPISRLHHRHSHLRRWLSNIVL